MTSKVWFMLGAIVSFLIALLHIVIIFIGAPAYRYFGAGEEMAALSEKGSFIPMVVTSAIALVFFFFGLYAWSATGRIKRLPFRKVLLIIIAGIYLLRGSGFFIEVLGITYGYDVPVRHAVFSLVALLTGLTYLFGLIKGWKSL